MRNILLILEYDGTKFKGFQRQKAAGIRTVQGEIESALCRMMGEPVRVASAGRTDAGVHALEQVVSFSTGSLLSCEEMHRALNALLPSPVVVRRVKEVSGDFHARHSAKSRAYRYLILNRSEPSALARAFAFHVSRPLDLEKMKEAAKYLVGTRDFTSFQVGGNGALNPVRTVENLEIWRGEIHGSAYGCLFCSGVAFPQELVSIEMEAQSFLRSMVRMIVGTLLRVGTGKLHPDDVKRILQSRDPRLGGPAVPPHGLYLVKVRY